MTGSVKMSDIKKYKNGKQENEKDEEELLLEKKLKRHKRGKVSKVVAVILIMIIVAIGYFMYNNNRVYTSYDVVNTVDIRDSYNSRFFGFGDYVLRYSEDGLAYLNGDETYWNQAFEMKEPIIDVCGDYVAIAEQKSNNIYICDTTAQQGKIQTEYPIVGLDVSENGVVAAITEEKSDVSHIEIIGKDGTKIAKGQTVLAGQGCPVDIAISRDGSKLAVSYLYVGNGVIESKVVFYNYSEVGKNEVDRFVGGFNFEKTMVARVEFLDNDTVAAFGDDKIVIYSMKQKPSIAAEVSIDKEIKSIFYSSEYIGAVLESGQADNPYIIAVYDMEGKKISETPFNMIYKDIKVTKDIIVIYSDVTMKVYTVDGKLKYEGNFEEGINSVIMQKDKYNYLIVSSSSIKEIKLK